IEAHPRNALAHWYLGCALWYQDKIEESLAPFRRGSQLEPNDLRHHHSLGNVLAALVLQRYDDLTVHRFRRFLRRGLGFFRVRTTGCRFFRERFAAPLRRWW
ncbi:MAG: hypothetical protein AB1832_19165, partial [Pseudomonadota bacterium]